jgi:hypothetical protein
MAGFLNIKLILPTMENLWLHQIGHISFDEGYDQDAIRIAAGVLFYGALALNTWATCWQCRHRAGTPGAAG